MSTSPSDMAPLDAASSDFSLPEPRGRVLIIAGSDSSGGAGIQADIKTCAAFGAFSTTAVTAVTAQNSQGVQKIELVPPTLVAAQIESAMTDVGADVVKIGMLGSRAVMEVVAEALETHCADALTVLDPVMVASSGDRLMDSEAESFMRETLLPLADIVTPNVPEAEVLTGMAIADADALREAGDKLLELGAGASVMKGGHLKGSMVIDLLLTDDGVATFTAPRLTGVSTHGTGCTLASAIAANLALGLDIGEAVATAREFVFEAIRTAPGFGKVKRNGPLNHGLAPQVGDQPTPDAPDNPFAVLKGLTPSSD